LHAIDHGKNETESIKIPGYSELFQTPPDVNINVTHCPSHINKNCCCDGVRLGVILKDYFIRSRGAQINDSLQRDSNMGCAG
jgi:hypothetical protein